MKTKTQKATILRRFKNKDVHIESARGTDLHSFKYIRKDEGIKDKIVKYTGD